MEKLARRPPVNDTLERAVMTSDINTTLAHGSGTDPLSKVRRRHGWALGSALGVLMMSITATVIILESHSTRTLQGTSHAPAQNGYPARSISDPNDGQGRTLQSYVPSDPDTGKWIDTRWRRT